jgi:hypothetical protein
MQMLANIVTAYKSAVTMPAYRAANTDEAREKILAEHKTLLPKILKFMESERRF